MTKEEAFDALLSLAKEGVLFRNRNEFFVPVKDKLEQDIFLKYVKAIFDVSPIQPLDPLKVLKQRKPKELSPIELKAVSAKKETVYALKPKPSRDQKTRDQKSRDQKSRDQKASRGSSSKTNAESFCITLVVCRLADDKPVQNKVDELIKELLPKR